MSCAAAKNERLGLRHSRIELLVAAGIWLCGCGESNDAGSASANGGATATGGASASGGATATGGVSANGGASTGGAATATGSTSASGGATAGGSTSATGGASAQGGTTGYKEPTQPTQETDQGIASTECVSPFQNAQLITADDAPRCDCQAETATCINGIQFVCRTRWVGVSVGSCAGANACLIVSGKTYQSSELQSCMSGSGDYPCTWELRFNLSVAPYFSITRGLGGRQSGEYHCDGMSILLGEGNSSTSATYDEATGTVTANGVTYVEAS